MGIWESLSQDFERHGQACFFNLLKILTLCSHQSSHFEIKFSIGLRTFPGFLQRFLQFVNVVLAKTKIKGLQKISNSFPVSHYGNTKIRFEANFGQKKEDNQASQVGQQRPQKPHTWPLLRLDSLKCSFRAILGSWCRWLASCIITDSQNCKHFHLCTLFTIPSKSV